MEKNNLILAIRLPGSENVEAVQESWKGRPEAEWRLDPSFFFFFLGGAVQEQLDVHDDVDMFAFRANHQIGGYVSR